jgi:hypothetical protein
VTDLAETILTGILTGLAADALWESGKWAWIHREAILDALKTMNREPVLLSGTMAAEGSFEGKLTVSNRQGSSWNVEAPTPSLARRLEELASWYLHVS